MINMECSNDNYLHKQATNTVNWMHGANAWITNKNVTCTQIVRHYIMIAVTFKNFCIGTDSNFHGCKRMFYRNNPFFSPQIS